MKRIFHNNIYNGLALLAICVLFLSACNKYLSVQPKGYQLLTTTTDYDQWLNNPALMSNLPAELNLLGDNVDEPTIPTPPSAAADLVYTWAVQFDPNLAGDALIWNNHYKSIGLFNTVIRGIDAATGSDNQKRNLKAEALLGRAFEYLYLVNEYGKEYDSSTAGTDLAVPFVTSDDIATPTPPRSTVQEIYDHIVADITAALLNLPTDNGDNRFRGSVAAGYSVLARTYLYMRRYPKAQQYASLALANGPHSIIDYNNLSEIADLMVRPDVVYARYPAYSSVTPTLGFIRSFDKNDLRLSKFIISDSSFTTRGSTIYYYNNYIDIGLYNQNWGTTVAELRLIIAEAAARSGDLPTALQQLDSVRKCRIATAVYKPYQSAIQDSVLQHVLDERGFEFAFTVMRWFDMRRLNKEGKMGTVYRYDGNNNIIATLAPSSPRYTLQIPIQIMQFNPGWPQNP